MHIKSHLYLYKNRPEDRVTFFFFSRSQGKSQPKLDLKIWIVAFKGHKRKMICAQGIIFRRAWKSEPWMSLIHSKEPQCSIQRWLVYTNGDIRGSLTIVFNYSSLEMIFFPTNTQILPVCLLHSRDREEAWSTMHPSTWQISGKNWLTSLEVLWGQLRNYSQQTWARTGPGQNNPLERGKFTRLFSCLVYVILPCTISKPIRNIYTNTHRDTHKHVRTIWRLFSQKWSDILTVSAVFMETKMILTLEEPTHLKSNHLFQVCSEMLEFVWGEFASGYFSHFCPHCLCLLSQRS